MLIRFIHSLYASPPSSGASAFIWFIVCCSQKPIIFFDPDEQPETSDEAARTGTDFHGIPAEYLALSAEEADTVYMIYRRESYIGNYSNGGPAFRAFTNIAMIHGTDEQLYRAAVNDPPEKIQAAPGSGAVGEYEPEKAFAAILEKLTGR